jgi:hypothetical protein
VKQTRGLKEGREGKGREGKGREGKGRNGRKAGRKEGTLSLQLTSAAWESFLGCKKIGKPGKTGENR